LQLSITINVEHKPALEGLMLKKYISLSFIFTLIFILFNTSCNGTKSQSNGFGSLTLPTSSTDSPDGSSNGKGNSNQFYVGVFTDADSISNVSNQTGFANKCAIDKTSTASQDIKCILDLPEGDAFTGNVSLDYNLPSGMCRYLRRRTYWYYNQEVGVGPTQIQMDITYDDTVSPIIQTGFQCSIDGGPLGLCTGFPEATINQITETPTCIYDKSTSAVGKNCCFGKYTLTKNIFYTNAVDISTVSNNNWGGSLNNCIGGPGKAWTAKSDKGIPQDIITFAKNGVNATYKLDKLINQISSAVTFPVANYYTAGLHTHTGATTGRTTDKPYFLDPVEDRNGTGIPTSVINPDNYLVPGNESYDFECLDASYEVIHRIRMYIREWDTYTDYLAYIASAGATVNPDRGSSVEPSLNCSGITGPCNDFYDNDDYFNIVLGLTQPWVPTMNVRDTYFPNVLE
jgi:hypothetical protein